MELKEEAPESINYLSGPEKQHFKEVLEYLDCLDIDYKINSTLVRGLDYYSRTVFEITEAQEEESEEENKGEEKSRLELAGGGRYNYLSKSIGWKKEIPAVGGSIGVDRILMQENIHKLSPRIIKKPKVFFIQLGFEAKLKSLKVIEILRKARVPIKQSLSKDSLSQQLAMAEKQNIPWVVILGQKEVMDNTVIVRNMKDRSQKTVSIDKLSAYAKDIIAK
jgi:histidyl-tRNA synthetase